MVTSTPMTTLKSTVASPAVWPNNDDNEAALMPSFFHVGPPRTGTTWLYYALLDHVSLPVPEFEETRFFDERYSRGMNWYYRRFRWIPDQPVGEICPTYFASPVARKRIATHFPASKIACTLRDPVARLYSLYRVLRSNGTLRAPFEQAVHEHPELLETARYPFYLQGWFEDFGRDDVLVMFYEDLISNPHAYVERFCKFIGVQPPDRSRIPVRKIEPSAVLGAARFRWLTRAAVLTANALAQQKLRSVNAFLRKLGLRRFLFRNPGGFPPLDPAAEARLRAELEPEVEALERLTGRDLSHWKRR
jgi:hypothetical protein